MYVTLYAADNEAIVLKEIEGVENAKLLFTNFYGILDNGNQIIVTCSVMDGIPKGVAENVLSIIKYVQIFYPEPKEDARKELPLPGVGALVVSVEPTPLHRDDYDDIVAMFQFETEIGELNICVPCNEYVTIAHQMIDYMIKSVKAYIDDPRPMSEKMGEEIEKELENLK